MAGGTNTTASTKPAARNTTTTTTTSTQLAGPAPPRRQHSSLVRIIAITLLALIVIVGLAALITWLIIRPRKLEFSLDEASIQNYNLNTNSNGHHLNSTFDLVIRSYNPNSRVSVHYDSVQVYVAYNGNDLAETDVDTPFFQGHKNVTRLRVQVRAQNAGLQDHDVRDLKRQRTDGFVDLDVRVRGRIRFKVGSWKSRQYKLKVMCSPTVIFSDSKRFQPTTCDVDI